MPASKRIKNLQKKLTRKTLVDTTANVFLLDYLQEWILDTIKSRLENKGTDKFNQKLQTDTAKFEVQKFYSNYTQYLKNISQNQHVTLKDSGDFYKSFLVNAKKTFYKIEADFNKPDGTIFENFTNSYPNKESFDNAILSLNEQEMEVFLRKIFLPEFLSNYKYELLK